MSLKYIAFLLFVLIFLLCDWFKSTGPIGYIYFSRTVRWVCVSSKTTEETTGRNNGGPFYKYTQASRFLIRSRRSATFSHLIGCTAYFGHIWPSNLLQKIDSPINQIEVNLNLNFKEKTTHDCTSHKQNGITGEVRNSWESKWVRPGKFRMFAQTFKLESNLFGKRARL